MADSTGNSGNMIPIKDWGKVIGAFGGNVPMPFVQELFLIECQIAGTTHVDEIQQKTEAITEGAILTLQRAPANPVDPNAIQVLNSNKDPIGFLPRAKNEILSRLMDGGKLLYAQVISKDDSNPKWLRISVKVFMRDI